MRLYIGLALFSLLAVPLAAAEPEALLRAGSLEIELDPAASTFLPVDGEKLQSLLCGGLPLDEWERISPRVECDISVSPPPRMTLLVDTAATSAAGVLRAAVEPGHSEPWRSVSPVATSCGFWQVSMSLDPEAAQPLSELALEPSAADPVQGAFAGVVKLAVRFVFANVETGASLELPAVLPLEMSGHWAAVPEGTAGLAEGASNLLLFAGSFDGQWLGVPACGAWGAYRCPVCFRLPPETLKRLE